MEGDEKVAEIVVAVAVAVAVFTRALIKFELNFTQ